MTMRIFSVCLLTSALFMPFTSTDAGSLSFNLFDLAEWASLLPAERDAEISLLLPFMLRVQIVCVLMFVVYLLTMRKTLHGSAVLLSIIVAVSQLPPIEIISNPNDPNYRQQLLIAALSLASSWGVLFFCAHNYTKSVLLLALTVSSGLLLAALMATQAHLVQYQLFEHFGLGGPVLLAGYLLAAFMLWQQKRAPQRSLHPSTS
jgi:hypothetical protein